MYTNILLHTKKEAPKFSILQVLQKIVSLSEPIIHMLSTDRLLCLHFSMI